MRFSEIKPQMDTTLRIRVVLHSWLVRIASLSLLAAPVAAADPVNLLRNADFATGTSNWVKAREFGTTDPVVAGVVRIYSPVAGFLGPVLSQGVNVTGIAGQTLTAAVDLAKSYGPPTGNSVSLTVEFTRAGGSHETVAIVQPNHTGFAPLGAYSTFTGNFTFPADAVKLVKASLCIVGPGSFGADNIVLTGPSLTPGPVPAIASLSSTKIAYHAPITLTGTDFGPTQGTVTVGGSADGIVVDSWSDTDVVFHLLTPNQGGVLRLVANDVMANQNLSLSVTSPFFSVSMPTTPVLALPGQLVKLNALLTFHNYFTTVAGIQLAIPGSGTIATFSPQPVRYQGGTRLTLDTTRLVPGVHTFTVQSSADTTVGNSVPLTIDIRIATQLKFSAMDPLTLDLVPVTGTLELASYDAISTAYSLLDGSGADITAVAPPLWTSSDPAILQVRQTCDFANGPSLLPQANGTCTLTATTVNGFATTIPIRVLLPAAEGIIDSIGFTASVTDNSGTGALNHFQATTNGGTTIASLNNNGFAAVDAAYHFGPTGIMDFRVPLGQAPGSYEFTAQNTAGISRSALLTVVNAPGTGLVSGTVARALAFHAITAGKLEFYDDDTGELSFTRMITGYGDFLLGGIAPGSYRLRFVPDTTFVPVPLDSPWYPNAPSSELSQPITVTAGNTTLDLNFFVFKASTPPPVVIAPQIFGFSRTGTSVSLSFDTEAGLNYTTEYSASMATDTWIQFDDFVGNGSSHTVTDSNATAAKRFYRVVVAAP